MGCGQEGFRAPEGPQGQRTPVFDTVETALDEIAGFVEGFGIPGLLLAVFPRRDTGFGLVCARYSHRSGLTRWNVAICGFRRFADVVYGIRNRAAPGG